MYKIKFMIYNLRARIQRFMRGYAYRDIWDMDMWFINTVGPMLKYLRDNGCGFPYEFENAEQWHDTLTEMIECLYLMDMDNVLNYLGVIDNNIAIKTRADEINTIINKNKTRFFELFSKYFYNLWD